LAISWEIKGGLVWVESTGDSGVAERISTIEAVLADPAYRSGMGLIYDVRRRTNVPEAVEIQQTVAYLASRGKEIGRSRWALVVNTEAAFGMGRMAGAMLESTSATWASGSLLTGRVFRDLAEAEAWVRGSD
jgi:hypothetical protein